MPVFERPALRQALKGCVGVGALVAACLGPVGAVRAEAMVDLTPGFVGHSNALLVSADGRVISGTFEDASGYYAFRTEGGAFEYRGAPGNFSTPTAMTADGRMIVGATGPAFGAENFIGYKYENGVLTMLGTLGGTASVPLSSTPDGSVIVGASYVAGANLWHAFKYVGGRMQDLGALGGSESVAYGVSADGRVIVGEYFVLERGIRAFRHENNVMTDLGTLGGGYATATFVSADGSIIVGTSDPGGGQNHAFRYVGGVMTDLGTLGGRWSSPNAMTPDGSVIVGHSTTPGDEAIHAFRYRAGTMTDLGTLGGAFSNAQAVSSNGRIIVGWSQIADNLTPHAFKHQNGVMTDLGTLGGTRSFATAVSADGRIIVGWSDIVGDAYQHAFAYRNALIDLANTASAISKAASNTRNAMAQRMGALSLMMDYDCNAFGAHNLCLSFGGRYSELNSSNAEGAGLLTLAYRIAPNVRIGAFLDYRVSQRAPWGLNYRSDEPTFGAFIGYGAQDGLGLQAKLTAAANHGGVTVTREASLANTEAGQGRASLNSWAVAGEIGWGFAFGDNWVATPYAGLRVMEAKLGAYSETLTDSVQFPLTYAGYGQRVTTLFGGLRLNGRITERVALFGSFGVEGDLSSKMDDVRGTSELPGMEAFTIRNPAKANRVRPFGSLGVGYDVTPNQRIQAQVVLRGSPYGSQVSKTALLTYRIAF